MLKPFLGYYVFRVPFTGFPFRDSLFLGSRVYGLGFRGFRV